MWSHASKCQQCVAILFCRHLVLQSRAPVCCCLQQCAAHIKAAASPSPPQSHWRSRLSGLFRNLPDGCARRCLAQLSAHIKYESHFITFYHIKYESYKSCDSRLRWKTFICFNSIWLSTWSLHPALSTVVECGLCAVNYLCLSFGLLNTDRWMLFSTSGKHIHF